MAKVTPPATEKQVENKKKTYYFVARPGYENQRAVIKPSRYRYDKFDNRVFSPGITIQFSGGLFETEDAELAERILKHPNFGKFFYSGNDPELNPEAPKKPNAAKRPDGTSTAHEEGDPELQKK